MSFKKNSTAFFLCLIILIAIFLRVWQLDGNPVSLFGDELDVGYQAYSLLTTGKDYMGNFLPFDIESLAEYRTPLFIYSTIPTVGIFGISAYGIRLPAALFGVLSVFLIFLLTKKITQNKYIALLACLAMAISPWSLQYSRAGFEILEMIVLLLLGIYLFLKGLRNHKLLPLAVLCLSLTPWVYSTAKLFLPLTFLVLISIFWKELKTIKKRWLSASLMILFIISMPLIWSLFTGAATQRFEGLSIFSDKTVIPSIGFERLEDAKSQNMDTQPGTIPALSNRLFHNQVTYLSNIFLNNYLQAFSTTFLFTEGETINPRQSVPGIGLMYKLDAIFILIGLFIFIKSQVDKKYKILIITLLLLSPIPAALTHDGATHSTRLMLMQPWLIFFIAWGVYGTISLFKRKQLVILSSSSILALYLISFIFYAHQYWIHYPLASAGWWHAGIKEAIDLIIPLANQDQKVVISNANEPMLKFFLAYSSFPPSEFQQKYPLAKTRIDKLGELEVLGKFYFITPHNSSIYQIERDLPMGYYYLAPFSEIQFNLVKEPLRIPQGLRLVQTTYYPNGEPAYYLLQKI